MPLIAATIAANSVSTTATYTGGKGVFTVTAGLASGYAELQFRRTNGVNVDWSTIATLAAPGATMVSLPAGTEVRVVNSSPANATVDVSLANSPTITVSTTPAYTAGDSIGGKIAIVGAVSAPGESALLHHIRLLDRANQKPTGTLLIFNSNPTAATITDNAAFVFSTDDTKLVAAIPVVTDDWTTVNNKAVADLPNLGRKVTAFDGTTLYAVFVASNTPTFAATTDLQAIVEFVPANE